jgi:bacteriocin-like protein
MTHQFSILSDDDLQSIDGGGFWMDVLTILVQANRCSGPIMPRFNW